MTILHLELNDGYYITLNFARKEEVKMNREQLINELEATSLKNKDCSNDVVYLWTKCARP